MVTGNVRVSGSVTSKLSEEVLIEDNIIVLNSNEAGVPSGTAGIEIERGIVEVGGADNDNVNLLWNETTDRWTFTNDGTNYYNIPISTEYSNSIGQEDVEDMVGNLITGSGATTVTYDDSNGTMVISSTDTNTNTQLTTEQVQDIAWGGSGLSGSGATTVTYNDSANTLVISSTDTNTQLTTEQVQDIAWGGSGLSGSGATTVTYNDSANTLVISSTDTNTNTQLTNEQVQDIVGGMVDGGTETNITVTYDDSSGKLNFVSTDTNTDTNTQLSNSVAVIDVSALTSSGQLVSNITHGLGSHDISVQLWETNSGSLPYTKIDADIERTDAATIKVTFGKIPPNDVRVVMIAENTTDLAGSAVLYPS